VVERPDPFLSPVHPVIEDLPCSLYFAQASRGIFSINDLFKEFVLTEPRALERWDVTLKP